MKLVFGLVLMLSLNVLAAPTYNLESGEACVLLITKQVAAAVVVQCGSTTVENTQIPSYSEMPNATQFQADTKKNFLANVGHSESVTCSEYDNVTMLLVICKKQ